MRSNDILKGINEVIQRSESGENELYHYRTKDSKNGIRRYQYPDGTWKPLGLKLRRLREGSKGDSDNDSSPKINLQLFAEKKKSDAPDKKDQPVENKPKTAEELKNKYFKEPAKNVTAGHVGNIVDPDTYKKFMDESAERLKVNPDDFGLDNVIQAEKNNKHKKKDNHKDDKNSDDKKSDDKKSDDKKSDDKKSDDKKSDDKKSDDKKSDDKKSEDKKSDDKKSDDKKSDDKKSDDKKSEDKKSDDKKSDDKKSDDGKKDASETPDKKNENKKSETEEKKQGDKKDDPSKPDADEIAYYDEDNNPVLKKDVEERQRKKEILKKENEYDNELAKYKKNHPSKEELARQKREEAWNKKNNELDATAKKLEGVSNVAKSGKNIADLVVRTQKGKMDADKKKEMDDMDDATLNKRLNRLRLEQQYAEFHPNETQRRAQQAANIIEGLGYAASIGSTIASTTSSVRKIIGFLDRRDDD